MAIGAALQLFHGVGIAKKFSCANQFKSSETRSWLHLRSAPFSSFPNRQDILKYDTSEKIFVPILYVPSRSSAFVCRSFPLQLSSPLLKNTSLALTKSYNALLSSPTVQLVTGIGILAFALWGLVPLMHGIRILLNHDRNWKKSQTYNVSTNYLQPLLFWIGAQLICRALEPVILPTEASQAVKLRLLHFVKSLSSVLAFAYSLTSFIQQAQKFFSERGGSDGARNTGFDFAEKAVFTGVWVVSFSIFMELLGYSTQKWLTAGGFGTVLVTLAGREIFTNFLSGLMIHAARPFVVNEWIQTKIEGYEVSGTVEHIGWWSPTIIRADDREAVHIPNHKFTVSVVRNLSQKNHWRIKTNISIYHEDYSKISNIIADMRKVLANNPQIEQKRLHRRVFLDYIDPESQALVILISCFVKTSRVEEYLSVKDAVLQDFLKIIKHHRARLATPIRTLQKIVNDNVGEREMSSAEAGTTSTTRPLLLASPIRTTGDDKPKKTPREEHAAKASASIDIKLTTADIASVNNSDKQQHKANSENGQLKSTKNDQRTSSTSPPTTGNESLNSAASVSKAGKEKPPPASEVVRGGQASNPASAKNESENVPNVTTTRPSYENNIVLGVALEGSKRTLPIEEMDTVQKPSEVKEQEKHTTSTKDKKGQIPAVPAQDKAD